MRKLTTAFLPKCGGCSKRFSDDDEFFTLPTQMVHKIDKPTYKVIFTFDFCCSCSADKLSGFICIGTKRWAE